MEQLPQRGPVRTTLQQSSRTASVLVGVAVNAPEAVLLLAPQHPLGGVKAGVGEGGPDVRAVAGHGVVEAAVPEQPEVGHPDIP